MTLRDLTPRQRQRLIARCGKQEKYWNKRPESLKPLSGEWFQTGFNEGVKAVLDILLTPKDERK